MKNSNTSYSSYLAAKVAAVNAVAAEVNRVSPLMIEALRPFIGKKVIKTTDRRFMADVAAVLPPSPEGLQRWLAHSDRGICFAIKTSRDSNGIANYAEDYFYAGEVDASGTLLKVNDPAARRADWTADEVITARKVTEEAKEAARQAESACGPFGLYDR